MIKTKEQAEKKRKRIEAYCECDAAAAKEVYEKLLESIQEIFSRVVSGIEGKILEKHSWRESQKN